MSKDYCSGKQVLEQIAEAIGLPPNTTHVVIDLPVSGVARVIRVDILRKPQADALAEALKTCTVEVV